LKGQESMRSTEYEEFRQGEGGSGSIITNHPFDRPEDRLWGLCRYCSLAEASHADAVRRYIIESQKKALPRSG
jgi:hypothetical protein